MWRRESIETKSFIRMNIREKGIEIIEIKREREEKENSVRYPKSIKDKRRGKNVSGVRKEMIGKG